MNHQTQNLSSFGLELKSFDVRTHEKTSRDKEGSLTMLGTTWQVGGSKGPCGALYVSNNLSKRAGQLLGFIEEINQLGGRPSRGFRSFRGLPALKIGTQNEEFPPNLDYANLFFLNDSAEMTYREASQTGGVGNIEKHPFRGT